MRPDYAGGSLVNLVASVVEARGGRPLHQPLKKFHVPANATNVVLLIIDGLGDNYLQRRHPDSALARRRRGSMTSVFPSTTASAITTSYTGRTPLEHGLTGWFTYFGEAGCVSAALPFRSRGDMAPLSARGVQPEDIYTVPSLFAAMPMKSIVVSARDIIDSQYNSVHCRGAEKLAYDKADELVAQVERAVKSSTGKKFVYAYWPYYDQVSHRYGSQSEQAAGEFAIIDAAFAELLQRLKGTDTVIIGTADHGFTDAPPEDCMELPAKLASMLRFPLCGERRVVYCHAQSPKEFLERAREYFEGKADVMPSQQLVDEGWLGPGEPHPRIKERVGDVTIVMRERYTVKDWVAGEGRWLHLGNHGGTHEDEMLIPVIVEEA